MARPLIYICYGMPKSGSTLAFTLTRAVLEDAGIRQMPVQAPGAIPGRAFNYVDVLRPAELDALTDALVQSDDIPAAIKTHSGLWNCVEVAARNGLLQAQAICRDPRDIALSMMDAAREGRAWGQRNGAPIRTAKDALPAVRAHVDKFERWAALPGVLVLRYDEVAFDTRKAARAIAEHVGVNASAERCARVALGARTLLNKGQAQRWKSEMSAAEITLFEREFGGFLERFSATGDWATGDRAAGG